MEGTTKQIQKMKRRDTKLESIYSRCLITKNVMLPITSIGKNLKQTIEENISSNYEGKCMVEGYIKPQSAKVLTYSSGIIERGIFLTFKVTFEADVCFPVEGTIVQCIAKNITKAGIRAVSATDFPSPIDVFLARDHHHKSQQFNEVKEGDTINARILGQRFELNDRQVSVIAEIVKPKPQYPNVKEMSKPKLIIEKDDEVENIAKEKSVPLGNEYSAPEEGNIYYIDEKLEDFATILKLMKDPLIIKIYESLSKEKKEEIDKLSPKGKYQYLRELARESLKKGNE